MPGPIRTAFWDGLIPPNADKDAVFDNVGKSNVPLLRVGSPEDIAGAALFLASELSSFVTGVGLSVAGGMPLRPSEGALTKV
jgi:NAD(P)-dependent dehydrogenase (short-subunit alcohol dehydrogenase family)